MLSLAEVSSIIFGVKTKNYYFCPNYGIYYPKSVPKNVAMPNPYFKFKKFTVYHDKCAMKVGTDGVLLGVWATVDGAKNVVDIGTGSGLIALMMAQRNPEAKILGIDVDESAVAQAADNFATSPFSERLLIRHSSFEEWTMETDEKVDSIISNPPFFSDSLQSPNTARTLARHNNTLPLESLFFNSKRKLTDNGLLSLILPYDQKNTALKIADNCGFSLSRITTVFPTPNSIAKRVLLEFAVTDVPHPSENQLIIEESRHVYSENFISLVKDFYLKM